MPVSTRHEDLRDFVKQWDIIRDCIAGEQQIKYRREKYLPRPNSTDRSDENLARYAAYIDRAVFYNVVKRSLGGLIGQVFSREPIIEVPPTLDPVIQDATGLGVNIVQLSKKGAGFALGYGRGGLFIDYPNTNGGATRAELASGDIRPMFTVYDPKQIINWRTIQRGGRQLLSLVVIEDKYVKEDDGFLVTYGKEYKVLRLVNNQYTILTYRDNTGDRPISSVVPLDAGGKPFDTIAFQFIGADDNSPELDQPPLYDLSSLNIAHYRNSADYEESAYITGQPTPWLSGLTEQWVKEILKGEVQLGSRAAIPLPSGAAAGLIQPNPNTLPFEAMKHKERQMVALGAKLVEPSAVQRTATEATIDQSYETSTLSASADNVSDAFTFGLKWAARFMGEDDTKVRYELNTEFDLIKLTPNERTALIAEWQAQAISFGEMRSNLRRAGIAMVPDEEAKAAILKELAELPAMQIDDEPDDDPDEPDEPTSNPDDLPGGTGEAG